MTSTLYEGKLEEEHLTLTVTTGGVYTSRLSKVYQVYCTPASDADARITAVIASDGRTIMFYTSGVAGGKVFVTLKGRKWQLL